MGILKDCINLKNVRETPVWFMRQAEDIYQKLEKLDLKIQTLLNFV